MFFVVFVVIVALVFDFTNGIHDAANSIATIVSTGGLTPRQAVIWAAFFNFIAFFIFGTAVAKTIGKGMIDISIVTPTVILGGLSGAIIWNLITWAFGIPSSSSHALIGGYAGSAVAKGGLSVIISSGWIQPLLFIFLAPVIGMVLGAVLIKIVSKILRDKKVHKKSVDKWSRFTQFFTASLYSLGHGGNDAQKTMGIITSLLFSGGLIASFEVPFWVVITAHLAIGLGTLVGGWRIVETMGKKITELRPIDGACAETAGAVMLFVATIFGIPVSTTHVITGAISGVGSAESFSNVNWRLVLRIIWAWIFTIPVSAGIGYYAYYLMN